MWLRLAVATAATITMMSAQEALTWEVAPVVSYLRLSHKVIGSANGSSPQDDDTKMRGIQPGVGVRLTWNTSGYYGIEASYLHSRARISSKLVPIDGSSTTTTEETGNIKQDQIFVNGICYFMPNGERFRPYITAGAQVQKYSQPPLKDWPDAGSRTIGFNYGGGVKIQLVKHALIRIDVRDIWGSSPYDLQFANGSADSIRSPGRFRSLEGSFGVGIRF